MKIVLPGGSGQVGHIVARHFRAQGHDVMVLSRPWDRLALNGCDIVINLAGRSVNCRYTAANRKEIYDSRIQSTLLLNEIIASLDHPPSLWINASTATIYRHAKDRAMDEESGELGGSEAGAPDTWNFSIGVAKDWEKAFFDTVTPRTRKIAIRSAMTFSPDRGGVFDVLSGLVRCGLGGAQGDGTQYVSWVHETDFARALDFLIAHEELEGIVNIASPNPLLNRDFMQALRAAWGIRVGLPAKAWMIEIGAFFMRTESELVLKSRRVVPGRLLASGFRFLYPDFPAAARELVSRYPVRDDTAEKAEGRAV